MFGQLKGHGYWLLIKNFVSLINFVLSVFVRAKNTSQTLSLTFNYLNWIKLSTETIIV